jgi:hypothetical protein
MAKRCEEMSDNARSRKLPKRYEQAITALLGTPTQAAAAVLIGVDVSTLRRWLLIPEFQEAYSVARQGLMGSTITQLLVVTNEAVATLKRNLTCGQFATEVRAAQAILEFATKGIELIDMEQRLAALEEQAERKAKAESGHSGNGS